MALKSLPHKLSNEDLLKALEKEDSREVILEGRNDVLPFLSHYNIEPGDYKVAKRAIFDLYRKWSDEPVTKTVFAREFTKYIPYEHSNFHFINIKAIEIGYKTFQLIQDHKYDKRKNPKHRAHFEKFLSTFDIKKGDIWIEGFVLFYLYDKWTYETKKQHYIGRKYFNMFLQLYLPNKRIGSSKMKIFKVDKNVLQHLPNIDSIRKGYYDQAPKRKETEDKKKQKQISRLRSKFKY